MNGWIGGVGVQPAAAYMHASQPSHCMYHDERGLHLACIQTCMGVSCRVSCVECVRPLSCVRTNVGEHMRTGDCCHAWYPARVTDGGGRCGVVCAAARVCVFCPLSHTCNHSPTHSMPADFFEPCNYTDGRMDGYVMIVVGPSRVCSPCLHGSAIQTGRKARTRWDTGGQWSRVPMWVRFGLVLMGGLGVRPSRVPLPYTCMCAGDRWCRMRCACVFIAGLDA